MTKNEILESLRYGDVVAHSSFSSDEHMKQDGRVYVFEDGCLCTPEEFWHWRTDDVWLTGWRIVSPKDPVCSVK